MSIAVLGRLGLGHSLCGSQDPCVFAGNEWAYRSLLLFGPRAHDLGAPASPPPREATQRSAAGLLRDEAERGINLELAVGF